ncbi:hypothetical protein N7486_009321 [Penicillium sp. IBT 16267x]|nr:hypothetical protein N7486_009321 [Penicillium sp. IBT 16267x]
MRCDVMADARDSFQVGSRQKEERKSPNRDDRQINLLQAATATATATATLSLGLGRARNPQRRRTLRPAPHY